MASHAFCEYILQASPRMHRIARDPIRPTPPMFFRTDHLLTD
jgi:hypothetical protein